MGSEISRAVGTRSQSTIEEEGCILARSTAPTGPRLARRDAPGGAATSSVLVAVVSPGWIASVSCQEEVRAFQGIAVISVLTLDVVDTMPEGLRRYQWEEFFTVDEKGVDRTFLAQDRGEFKRGIETIAASIVRLLALPAPQTIERTRETARSHVAPIIGQRCGTTRILDMERPIDSDAIYTPR